MKIGFIGLGIMGESMCENILKKSREKVLVFDLNSEKIEKLVSMGAEAAASSLEIGKKCDVILTMVPKSEHVVGVYEELLPVLTEGKLLIEMSTIDPSVSRKLSAEVRKKGSQMIDAPVVKSKAAAIKGELGIYVGGEKDAFQRAKSVLEYMGNNIIYMGLNGSGLVMKICHNMLVSQIQNGVNEMVTLAEKSGLNIDDVFTAISYGGGQNFYLDSKKNAIKNNDFTTAFSVENMNKDINIAVKLAGELNLNLPGAQNSREVYKKAMNEGYGKEDFSATIKVVKSM
ncbi:NAD(P)-dependent oxidoreductase [Clostridium sp. LBM24168]